MSNLSGLRDINNTQWTQVPGPEIERLQSLLKGIYDIIKCSNHNNYPILTNQMNNPDHFYELCKYVDN